MRVDALVHLENLRALIESSNDIEVDRERMLLLLSRLQQELESEDDEIIIL